MPLHRLDTYQFRNLENTRLSLNNGLQVVYGDNASGKTSILDAIHVLCSGKSFLGASPRKLQQFNTQDFSLNGLITQNNHSNQAVQYRWQDNQLLLSIGQQIARRTSEYAALQPVQAITPLSYRLIDDTPEARRRFMDWGVFHVKHDYIDIWRRFQRSLLQRNAMLSSGTDLRTLSAWSHEYVQLSESLDCYRQEYVERLNQQVQQYIVGFLPDDGLTITYHRGWDKSKSLEEILFDYYDRDRERRFTYYGPQRADIVIRFNGVLAKDAASRGQKKLITFAFYLAQASVQQEIGQHSGVLLVDDLPSELDTHHVGLVMDILFQLPMQVVVSTIAVEQLQIDDRDVKKLFHVKQGCVEEVVQ